LRGEARRFIDDEQVVVFVEDFQGRRGHAEYYTVTTYTVARCLHFH
jgi:hypothetical protein